MWITTPEMYFRRLLVEHKGWRLNLIRREANSAANLLATKACAEGWSSTSRDACPIAMGSNAKYGLYFCLLKY